MVNRSISALFGLCAVAAVVVLGTTALLQVSGATPAGASPAIHLAFGWGSNIFGDLGVGTPDNNTGPDTCGPFTPCAWTPAQMSLPAGVTGTAIAAGLHMSYAIGSDGNLYASGLNDDGELGDGTNTGPDVCTQPLGLPSKPCSTVPVQVLLPSGVSPTVVAAGYESGYAIGSDGKLYAWGENLYGELGTGTATGPDSCSTVPCSDTPVQVSLPTGVTAVAIAAGASTGYAIGSDQKLYAWGYNGDGELGDGPVVGPDICDNGMPCSTIPVQVLLPTGVTATAIAGGLDGWLRHRLGREALRLGRQLRRPAR